MKFTRSALLISATAMAGAITFSGASLAQDAAPSQTVQTKPSKTQVFAVEMQKGEVLQVIASQSKPGGQAAARQYGQVAFPLAQSHGFQRFGQLNVQKTVVSDFAPEVFTFYSWPSQTAADAFAAEPKWPAIKSTRPDAWSELKVYSTELQKDLNLSFATDKHYSVLVAWLKNDEAMADYSRYLKGIEPAVERSGGRFIYKMRMPSMESHASDPVAPHQITFVEWESDDGFANVQKSEEYAAHQRYFGSSMKRFEFYWLKTPG